MSFGNKLQNLRKNQNLNQEELATKIGVSQKTISSWETDRTSPSISDLDKLCSLFNVQMGYFSEIETRCTKPVFAPVESSFYYYGDNTNDRLKDEIQKTTKFKESQKISLAQVIDYIEQLSREEKDALAKVVMYILKEGD